MQQIQSAICRTERAILWRNPQGKGHPLHNPDAVVKMGVGGDGAPDLIGYLRGSGRFFALEVKTDTGRLSKDQIAWAAAHSARGPFVATVRSVEESIAALERAEAGACE